MRCVFAFVLAVCSVASTASRGAAGDVVELSGYVRESPLLWRAPAALQPVAGSGGHEFTNLLHTRENLRIYPSSSVTLALELKTRLSAGDGARELLDLTNLTGGSRTYFDWERRFVDEESLVLACALDRAWIDAVFGRAQFTLGRQRIAWGTGLVWNPIDVFNPSSPLDFDNWEKPGTDAGRVQVYTGPNSKIEVAVAPMRRADDTIAAVKIVLNQFGYDWTVLGGRRGPYAIFGCAWAGSIHGGGFRGEFLYSDPRDGLVGPESPGAAKPRLDGSVDGDYTLASSLYLHGAVLYNERGTTGYAGGPRLLAAYRLQWLTPARLSLFAEAARDLGSLVRITLSGILNPYDLSWYVGPQLTWSVATNVDFLAGALLFGGSGGTEFGDNGRILMVQLEWSF
jgi:hypothetical protein